MDIVLLHNLGKGNVKRTPEHDFDDGADGKTKVFMVDGKISFCKMWNASNNSSFDLKKACEEISDKLVEDENIEEGHFSIEFNEIWFEIKEKNL